jgi:hypothetical protein
MAWQGIKRLALVGVVVAALVGAVGVHPSGAKTPRPTTTTDPFGDLDYSQSDCETLLDIQVDDSGNGGYFGATARNAAKAYRKAAKQIDDEGLRTAMNNLATIWAAVGAENNAIAAAKITARKSKAYGKALGVYTKAVVWCGSQSFEEPTTTTEFDDSSSDSSSSDTSSTEDTTSDTSSQ